MQIDHFLLIFVTRQDRLLLKNYTQYKLWLPDYESLGNLANHDHPTYLHLQVIKKLWFSLQNISKRPFFGTLNKQVHTGWPHMTPIWHHMTPKWPLDEPKMNPRLPKMTPPDPYISPSWPLCDPIWPQDDPRWSPKWPLDNPRWPQNDP